MTPPASWQKERVNASKSHYEVLQVSPDASARVIRAAYQALISQHHPDRHSGPAQDAASAEINFAYAVLSDPQRRKLYDGSFRAPSTSAGPMVTAASADRLMRVLRSDPNLMGAIGVAYLIAKSIEADQSMASMLLLGPVAAIVFLVIAARGLRQPGSEVRFAAYLAVAFGLLLSICTSLEFRGHQTTDKMFALVAACELWVFAGAIPMYRAIRLLATPHVERSVAFGLMLTFALLTLAIVVQTLGGLLVVWPAFRQISTSNMFDELMPEIALMTAVFTAAALFGTWILAAAIRSTTRLRSRSDGKSRSYAWALIAMLAILPLFSMA